MKTLFTRLTVLIAMLIACDARADGFPQEIVQHINKHLIGHWGYTTTWNDETSTSTAVWRWSDGGGAVIHEIDNSDEGYTMTEIGGWDPVAKALVFHQFSSRGDLGTVRYDQLTDAKWKGHGEGMWKGKEWRSPTVIEFNDNGFRYKDTTEGKPFVVVGKRGSTKAAEKSLAALGRFMNGTWIRTGDAVQHTYRWGLDKKFMRSNGRKDPQAWDGFLGVDLGNGKVGWWGFFADGSSGVLHLIESSEDHWTFEGTDYGLEGPFHRKVVIKKLGVDELHGLVEDTVNGTSEVRFDEKWKRKGDK